MTMRVREAAVAGSWYPGEPDKLAQYVDGLLAAPAALTPTGRVRALIEPHAGYRYSGPVASTGYRLVRGETRQRVILLGPSHRGFFRGLSVSEATHYRTPLGDIPLDVEAAAKLRQNPLVASHAAAEGPEHSLEIQLPFLQRALKPGWRLLPILVGGLEPGDEVKLAQALRPLVDDDALVVASGDFTHYGPSYGYLPFPLDGRTAERLQQLDEGALARLISLDLPGLVAYERDTGITSCGLHSFLILLGLLDQSTEGKLVRYDTSGAITGDYTNSVSYMTIAFFGGKAAQSDPKPRSPSAGSDRLNDDEMRLLHRLALSALERSVHARRDVSPEEVAREVAFSERLKRPSGSFVTLKKRGELRGCIGMIEPRDALWRSVAHSAVSAARHDPRFTPVEPDELAALSLEVSVLSPPRPIPSWRDFRVGEQGITLEKWGRRAVFLPEVAREQGWSAEETLMHLSIKAGLPSDAWKEGANFHVFTSQVLEAPFVPAPATAAGGR